MTRFDIPDLLKQMPESSYRKLGNDFFIAKLGYNESLEFMKYPVRFNGGGVRCFSGSQHLR